MKKSYILWILLLGQHLFSYEIILPDQNLQSWLNKRFEITKLYSSNVSNILISNKIDEDLKQEVSRHWPNANILINKAGLDFYLWSPSINVFVLKGSDINQNWFENVLSIVKGAQTFYIDLTDVDQTQFYAYQKVLKEHKFMLVYKDPFSTCAIFTAESFFTDPQKFELFKQADHVFDEYDRYYIPDQDVYFDLEKTPPIYDSIKDVFLRKGLPYEAHIGSIIHDLIEEGSKVVDLGAHIGVHTLTMSQKAGPQGMIYAFEPGKVFYLELLNNLRINNCDNVVPISKCVGEDNKLAIYLGFSCSDLYDQETLEQMQKDQKALEEAPTANQVEGLQTFYDKYSNINGSIMETVKLDDFNITDLSFIKMDIEGFEYYALKGAEKTLLREKPVITFECWVNHENPLISDRNWREQFDRIYYLLKDYGYEVFSIFASDFIAFPTECNPKLKEYQQRFKKIDLENGIFDVGL